MVSSPPFATGMEPVTHLMADAPRHIDPATAVTADNIRSQRKARGLTQDDLGKAVGVSGRAVRNWESGLHLPEGDVLDKVSEFLGLDADTKVNKKKRPKTEAHHPELEMVRAQLDQMAKMIETMAYLLDRVLPPKR